MPHEHGEDAPDHGQQRVGPAPRGGDPDLPGDQVAERGADQLTSQDVAEDPRPIGDRIVVAGQRDHRRDRREHGIASADAAEMMNCQVALI